MNQSSFNIRVGDNITFLGKTDSCFNHNGKYRVVSINIFGEYPFNEAHQNQLAETLDSPKIITIRDKHNNTFFLIYTNDGFYDEMNDIVDFDTFTIERKLRKEKLDQINDKNKIR